LRWPLDARELGPGLRDLAPIIAELRAGGIVTLQAIADGFNERGIPTARGGQWRITQVVRLLETIDSPFDAAVAA
jgi:hypothetical protein